MAFARKVIRAALITGGANGIGAAFARILAARGARLWLVDKQDDALRATAAEVRTEHGVAVEAIHADLVEAADQDAVVEIIRGIGELDLLVNNAGFGVPGAFHEIAPEAHTDMLQVHVVAPVRFSRAALPSMLARKSGAIVNVGSIYQHIVAPGNAMYGATKSFLNTFSRSLDRDVREHGVKIQLLMPGYTKTHFHDTEAYAGESTEGLPAFLWSTPEAVAEASLKALTSRSVICVPGALNRFFAFVLGHGLVPTRLLPSGLT